MAKKSAYSKGFRKTIKKDKPFLTKKEIIALIIIVAAVALAIILFNLLYDDGFVDGKDIAEGEIATYASTQNRERYLKLGTVNELEGYTLESTRAENGVISYTYTPNEADEAVEEAVIVRGSCVNAAILPETIKAYSGNTITYTDTFVEDVQGQQAYIYGVTYNYFDETYAAENPAEEPAEEPAAEETAVEEPAAEEAPVEEATAEEAAAEEQASNTFVQSVTCDIAYNDTHCVVLEVSRVGHTDGSFYLSDDQVVEFIKPFLSAVTVREDGRTMAFADYTPAVVEEVAAEPAEEAAAEEAPAEETAEKAE